MLNATTTPAAEFAAEVRRDLALLPKQLQSKYLYDPLGSSLFEAICRLPWYHITRAEHRLLIAHAREIVGELGERQSTIVELGCGSGEKLVVLAEALQRQGGTARVHLIDVSSQALNQTKQRLTRLEHVSVVGHQSTYEVGLRQATQSRDGSGPIVVLLLGSNIGNFDTPAAQAFLRRIRLVLQPADLLLLGADLVKPAQDLQLAYDDPLGVTAAFNKNLLVRINRELGGTFNLAAFAHRASWNPGEQRIEMHLVSSVAQTVTIAAARVAVSLLRGEHIWTESSYKYEPDQIARMGEDAGFSLREQWIEERARFALSLFEAGR
jgi:L-histidine N-alpha-methyltransferase